MNSSSEGIRFSVVVPTRNRATSLERLLRSLDAQCFPREQFEIIIVDDAGDVSLEPLVEPYAECLRVVLVRQERRRGCAGARQAGVERARGEYLAFTDDDCEPGPQWLQLLDQAAKKRPGAGLGGRTKNANPDDMLAETSQLVVNQFVANCRDKSGDPLFFPTCNVVFPLVGFLEAGGLDSEWEVSGGEDRDLCRRWTLAGFPMDLVPEASVAHRQAMSGRRFLRQHFCYGRGAARHLRQNGPSSDVNLLRRMSLPPLMVRESFRGRPVSRALAVAALVAVSQVSTMFGIVYELACSAPSPQRPPRPLLDFGRTRSG